MAKKGKARDEILHFLKKIKDHGASPQAIINTVTKKAQCKERTVWKNLKRLRDEAEIIKREEIEGARYYLPKYAPKKELSRAIGTANHETDIKEKILQPMLAELNRMRVVWNGVGFIHINEYSQVNGKNEQQRSIKTDLHIEVTTEDDMVECLLSSAKYEYDETYVDRLWNDFIQHHVNDAFEDPSILIERLQELSHALWEQKKEIFNVIDEKIAESDLPTLIAEIAKEEKTEKEVFLRRCAKYYFAVLYKLVSQKNGGLSDIHLDNVPRTVSTARKQGIYHMSVTTDPIDCLITDDRPIQIAEILFPFGDNISQAEKEHHSNLEEELNKVFDLIVADKELKHKAEGYQRLLFEIIDQRQKVKECLIDYSIADLRGGCPYTK